MSVFLSNNLLKKDSIESPEVGQDEVALTKRSNGLYQFYWALRARDLPTIELKGQSNQTMILRIEEWLNSTDFSKLRTLDLSSQGLTFIPEQIDRFKKLTWLNVADNHLEDLPYSMKELTRLKHLDITGNKFSRQPRVLSQLVSLKYLFKDSGIIFI